MTGRTQQGPKAEAGEGRPLTVADDQIKGCSQWDARGNYVRPRGTTPYPQQLENGDFETVIDFLKGTGDRAAALNAAWAIEGWCLGQIIGGPAPQGEPSRSVENGYRLSAATPPPIQAFAGIRHDSPDSLILKLNHCRPNADGLVPTALPWNPLLPLAHECLARVLADWSVPRRRDPTPAG